MLKSLYRLRRFVDKYRGRLIVGVTLFLIARLFEATIPLALKIGIDSIEAGDARILWPVLSIVGAVLARFVCVTYARMHIRRVGLMVSFDLRQQLYEHLQLMGPKFFGRYTIGDMMTRAVADISLIQRLISHGTILFVILFFAAIVGFGFMLALSPSLTLLILPPLPFIFIYAWHASREMGVTSRAVQERLS
ncbi:MAG: ABC transporter transmembrane domain-containing protein, partial [Gammaproteobacteria bacterium]|nr:ABC transporter transmembrane domain-containing protein [Gammaproteobacteria bacterium]